MSTFSIKRSFSCVPMEETSFTDTTQKVKTVHSLIDRGISGTVEVAHGTTSTNVQYLAADISENIELSDLITGTILTQVKFLAVAITSALTGIEDEDASVRISFSGTNIIKLQGVGDFASMPVDNIAASLISLVQVPGSEAHVEIIVGLA